MKYYGKDWYLNECGRCDSEEKRAERKKYFDELEKYKHLLPEWYDNAFTVHDLKIIKFEEAIDKNGNKVFIMYFDCGGGFMEIESLAFKNYSIIEDAPILNSYCLGDEIYANENGGFEFHLLLDCYDLPLPEADRLKCFTISCAEIELKK